MYIYIYALYAHIIYVEVQCVHCNPCGFANPAAVAIKIVVLEVLEAQSPVNIIVLELSEGKINV